jgi:hypothetical protein
VGHRTLDGLTTANQILGTLASTAVRAAAMSATFLLVNRAALELDIDPEEFDVIEPRVLRPGGAEKVPVLQIADHLVNGAGFCVALATPRAGGSEPLIAELLRSSLSQRDEYPLRELLRDDHPRRCEQACYRCLLRYRNQPYHGILDWRMGLAFLGLLESSTYACGLDGDMTGPALEDWSALVEQDILRLRRQFTGIKTRKLGNLSAVRFDEKRTWLVVAHPLWDTGAMQGVLRHACEELDGEPYAIIDSFNLARRPWTIRRAILTDGGT